MDPAALIPQPDVLQVHWGWFQALLIVTFLLHLLLMNVMLGSSLIALFSELGAPVQTERVNKEISGNLPFTIAFTVNFGVAPLLFLQVLYGHFMYTSSILMAVYWLSVIALLITAYYCAYIYSYKFTSLQGSRTIFIALSTVLLLLVGFFFTNNMTMMVQPATWVRYFNNASGTLLNLADPMLWPRYLHFVIASIAVAGLYKSVRAALRRNADADHRRLDISSGLRWFSAATVLQILVGFWFLFSLPENKTQLFIGANVYATLLLVIGLVGALMALVFSLQNRLWPTIAMTLATILVMVLMRDALRRAYLSPYFSLSDLQVVPQYSPLIAFLITFVVGFGVVAYMLKLAATAGREV